MRTLLRNTRRGWMTFSEADKGASGGGGEAENKEEQPETEPKPEGETLESKLSSATGHISSLWTRLQSALTANKRLSSQFETAVNEAKSAKEAQTKAEGSLKSEQGAHKTTGDKLKAEETNCNRLEKLCGLRGIDSKKVVPAATESSLAGSGASKVKQEYADLVEKEKKGEAEPGTSYAYFQQHKKELS